MTTEAGRLDIISTAERLTVAPRGGWTIGSAAALDAEIGKTAFGEAAGIRLDLSGLTAVDSAGALLLVRLRRRLEAAGRVETIGLRPDQAALVERVAANAAAAPPAPVPHNPFMNLLDRVGRATCKLVEEAHRLLNFLGLTVISIGRSAISPTRIRFVSFVSHLERVGLDAMPIVGLLSFLIGVVIAYQGADELRQFGAEIFTVNLVGISIMREMGVILTAIVVAGRSGSAFAAEIGTMQVNQEVDAMRTLGLDPMELLVLPRTLALVLAMPLLGVYADIMGLAGGAVMSMTALDISLAQYIDRLQDAVGLWTFWVGIIKAPVFGFLIALTGCREGLEVGGSAESVGRHTTRAVVISIFLVIVTDAVFSILFSLLHI